MTDRGAPVPTSSLLGGRRAEAIIQTAKRMTLPELVMLGKILKRGEGVYGMTWTEDRLFDNGLIGKFMYDFGYRRAWATTIATPEGREVYHLCRENYAVRHGLVRRGHGETVNTAKEN